MATMKSMRGMQGNLRTIMVEGVDRIIVEVDVAVEVTMTVVEVA